MNDEARQGKRDDQVSFSAWVLMWCAVLFALAVIGGSLGLIIATLTERPL